MTTIGMRGTVPVSRTFDSQGLNLHYLDWGNDHLPTLILLHGIQDHARSWDGVAAGLCDSWRVVALDLRGHGDSDWSGDGAYLAPYILMDLVELVDHLGVDKVSIIAHSFGGNAAARFAAMYPERVEKLVLVDAMGPGEATYQNWEALGAVKRTRDWLEKRRVARGRDKRFASIEDAANRLRKGNPGLSPDQALHLARHGVRDVGDGYVWKHDPVLGNFLPEDFVIRLSEFWQLIPAPVLTIWGAKSWTSNPATDGAAAHFEDCRCVVFENAGHWIHHDDLPGFVGEVRRFLAVEHR